MKHLRIEAVEKAFSLFNIQDYTLTLAEFERTASYCKFDASTRYVMEMLKQAGFAKIERLVHKADGKNSALECIMPEAWDLCGRSFLRITSPDIPEYDRWLSDSDRRPQEAVIWSAPTPKNGVDGEIVPWTALAPEHLEEARGKWIFLESKGVDINGTAYRSLAEAGAAGLVLTNFVPEETSPDDVVWFNGQGFNSWYHEKEAPRMPVFSVPPRRARKLLELLKKGPVFAHGEMKTRIYDGEIYTVTAVIPGESKEEYALFAHLYEPFAADDALGFGVACELGRQLVRRGVKLKKTLRVVFSMELYGFSAFLADPKRRGRIFAAMNLDSCAHWNRVVDFRMSPIFLPRFTDWFYHDWFTKYLPSFQWTESRGNLSDDTFGGDPAIGVATNWFRNPGGIYHHNTGRYFELDWLVVKEEFPVLAGAVEELITVGPSGNYDRRAAREMKAAVAAMLKDPELTAFEKGVRLEAEYDRYTEMLRSWEKFTGMKADFGPLEAAYETLKGKTGTVRRELFGAAEWRSHGIVPERLRIGAPFCLSYVPYPERRRTAVSRMLWSLFDGKRDLLTCIRILDGNNNSRTLPRQIAKIIADLRFLEKYGYVRLHPAATVGEKEIQTVFRKLGLRSGMKLVVHSAFSAIGRVEGGPKLFCRMLQRTIGKTGTLLMPVFTFPLYEGEDFGQPFDYRETPSCCGILSETFRKMPGVLRSADPCHSFAAWGAGAADFVRDHHKVPTVSEFSPLGLLEAADGWCLTVSAANAVTFMHVVESSFGVPCLGVRTEEFPAILADGRKVKLRTWGWRATTCPDCPERRTAEIFELMRKAGALREASLGGAQLLFFRLADYRKAYASLLRKIPCRDRKARPRVCSATVRSDWDARRNRLKNTDAFTGEVI